MSSRLLHTFAAIGALTCATASAGVITGTVVDSQGNPVRNALFEFKAASGGTVPFATGASTDANGAFTTTLTPDGTYNLVIYPQAAPLSLAVVTRIHDVVVGPATNNLGSLTLPVGVQATGRITNVNHTPLVSVGMHFVVPGESQPLDFSINSSDLSGNFNVTIPYGECEVQIEPGPVPYYGGPNTAARSLHMHLSSSDISPMNLGDVVLPVGYGMSALVLRQSDNTALANMEFQWVDRSTGEVLYVPKPQTDNAGSISFPSPAGSYDLRLIPKANDNLAAKTVSNITVPPGQSLGTILMVDGFQLKGRVRGVGNVTLADVQVTLFDHATQNPLYIGDVRTGTDGRYSVLVPGGNFDVSFSPPFDVPFARDLVSNVSVSGTTTVDGTPQTLPFSATTGAGTPGSGGFVPQVSASSTPRVGNATYAPTCSQGCGGAMAIAMFDTGFPMVVFGASYDMSTHALRRRVQLGGALGVAGAGAGAFEIPIPDYPGAIGTTIQGRFYVRDAAAFRGWSTTPMLQVTVQP